MKNLYYQNKNKYNFQKGNRKNVTYIPKPKHSGKPIFEPGDLVGFRNHLKGTTGQITYYRRNKETGEIEYIVDLLDAWSIGVENVYLGWEMFLKPLTRKVLVEKYLEIKKNTAITIVTSGFISYSYSTITVNGTII